MAAKMLAAPTEDLSGCVKLLRALKKRHPAERLKQAAVRKKAVAEQVVGPVEAALFAAAGGGGGAGGDRAKFKELTRLLAKALDEAPATLAGLNGGALSPEAAVAGLA